MASKEFTERKNNRLDKALLTNQHKYRTNNRKFVIDLDVLRGLSSIGCTIPEIAGVLGCSIDFLNKEREHNALVALAMVQGDADMKQSLRRAQVAMALNGSAAMLIWLGKQHLGQSDKQVNENNTTISVTVQRATEALRNIPRGQLLAAQAMLEQGAGQVIENSESGD